MVGGGGELVVRYGTSMVRRVMVIAASVASCAQKSNTASICLFVRSFNEIFITSICRRIEVQLNIESLCGDILRARLATERKVVNDEILIPNFIVHNVKQIARCGIVGNDKNVCSNESQQTDP